MVQIELLDIYTACKQKTLVKFNCQKYNYDILTVCKQMTDV